MRTEVLAMICQVLESYEESVTKEQNPQGQPQTPIQPDSCQQINQADIEVTLRKALGLKEKEKQENADFTDPLNIGL